MGREIRTQEPDDQIQTRLRAEVDPVARCQPGGDTQTSTGHTGNRCDLFAELFPGCNVKTGEAECGPIRRTYAATLGADEVERAIVFRLRAA